MTKIQLATSLREDLKSRYRSIMTQITMLGVKSVAMIKDDKIKGFEVINDQA